MKTLFKNPFFAYPLCLFFVVGAFVLYQFPYGDEILLLNPLRTPFLNTVFIGITLMGEWYFWLGGLVLLLLFKLKHEAIAFLCVGILLIPVNYYLKDYIGIDRPITYFEKQGIRDRVITVPNLYLNSGQTSFPSGHTASGFALYTLLAFFLLKNSKNQVLALPFVSVAILIAYSRIFLVQHFMVDILGGACVGIGLGWVGIQISALLSERTNPIQKPLA